MPPASGEVGGDGGTRGVECGRADKCSMRWQRDMN